MKQDWIEIWIEVPPAGTDLICQELTELGCAGVIVEERLLDTFVPPDPDEVPSGSAPLRAFFPRPDDPQELARSIEKLLVRLAPLIPGLAVQPLDLRAVQREDWAEGWKQHFGILRIGPRLVIRPTWEEYCPAAGEAIVTLDPGMAFGTGTHGTTRLCLEALAELFERDRPPRRLLDVGTGSGILAIAAAALGAERVLACDIDPEACRTARENIATNGLADRIEITDRPLHELSGKFEVILANILAEENVRLAAELIRRLAAGGTLILSGILREKEPLVIAGFSSLGLQGPDIRHREDWSCLLYRKG